MESKSQELWKVIPPLLAQCKQFGEQIESLVAKNEDLTRRLQSTEEQVKSLSLFNTGCHSTDFDMIKQIKSIYIGEAYKVRRKSDRSRFVLYKILVKTPGDGMKRLNDRIQNITSLRHQNLIQFRSSWIEMHSKEGQSPVPAIHILSDSTDKNTLDFALRKGRFDSTSRCLLFEQLVSTLEYIHGENVVHGNIRNKSIIYVNPKQLKICDFGISVKGNDFLVDQVEFLKKLVHDFGLNGTESLESFDIGRKIDLFSLGIVYFNMCFPINTQGSLDALHKIAYGPVGTVVQHITTEDAKTIKTLLSCFKSQSSVTKMLSECKSILKIGEKAVDSPDSSRKKVKLN